MTDTLAPAAASVTVTPYLTVRGGVAALDFYRDAFGAVEDHRMVGDDGRVGHAAFSIGAAKFFLADEHPEIGVLGPQTYGGATCAFSLEVPDVDAAVRARRRRRGRRRAARRPTSSTAAAPG